MKEIPYFLAILLLLVGCSDDNQEIATYDIPKETQEQPETTMPNAETTAPMQPLPGMQDSVQGAGQPLWMAPDTWQEQPLGSMRKGSWIVDGPGGEAEISITAFPGDVGGLQMNIQRWAGQVGLPATAAQTQAIELPAGSATLVRIAQADAPKSTLAAILEHDGYSWFFKMMGPDETVRENRALFLEFLNTVNFSASAQ